MVYGPSEDFTQQGTGFNALHIAASQRNSDCLIYLVQQFGWNPNKTTHIGTTAMMMVRYSTMVDALYALAPGLVNTPRSSDGTTPVMHAAMQDRQASLQRLIALGADVNTRDLRGASAVFYAGSADVLDILDDADADVFALDSQGMSALHYASGNGNFHVAFDLIWDWKLDIMKRNVASGMSPLDFAVKGGHLGVAKIILEYCPFDQLHELLERYALYEDGQEIMYMPIHEAVQSGNAQMVHLLLRFHAHEQLSAPVMNSIHGHLPIHLAVHELSPGSQVFDVLLRAGADVNAFNGDGFTPLYIACRLGMHEIVERLVCLGADVNRVNSNTGQGTPLYAAIESLGEDVNTVEILIMAGADTTFVTPHGSQNLLHLAALYNKPKVLQLLLTQSTVEMINACCQGDVSGTPLHCAVFSGSIDSVELLLAVGANVEFVNREAQTPHAYACNIHAQDVEDGYAWGVHGTIAQRLGNY